MAQGNFWFEYEEGTGRIVKIEQVRTYVNLATMTRAQREIVKRLASANKARKRIEQREAKNADGFLGLGIQTSV